jgi:hypothetical protein
MSQATPAPQGPVDEAQVEKDLRRILFRLDRTLGWLGPLFGFILLAGLGGLFYLFWWVVDLSWWKAALCALGIVLCVLTPLMMRLENFHANRALRRFNRRFPPNSATRPVALRILSEMESPNQAEKKLQEALSAGSAARPEDLIVRHRREAPEGQLDAALGQAGGTALPSPAIQPAPSPAVQPPPAPAPQPPAKQVGGKFDYIPLDPQSPPPPG